MAPNNAIVLLNRARTPLSLQEPLHGSHSCATPGAVFRLMSYSLRAIGTKKPIGLGISRSQARMVFAKLMLLFLIVSRRSLPVVVIAETSRFGLKRSWSQATDSSY
jgi:hypothetical protein